jgi:hypothetical protein
VTSRTFSFGVSQYRYNPGHYSSMQRRPDARTQAEMSNSIIRDVNDIDITKGFLKRYTWRSFEPSLGVYTLATHELASDLAYCLAGNKKLIVMIEDMTYGGTYGSDNPTPPYLGNRTPANTYGGFSSARWDPYVLERRNALHTAFYNYFGSHPALEGIMHEETSLALSTNALNSVGSNTPYVRYTPELYRDALSATITHWRSLNSNVRWFFYMNFMPSNLDGTYLDQIVQTHKPAIVICGPDAEQGNAALESRTFHVYRNNKLTCPVMAHLSTQVYDHVPAPTGEEMYTFAVDDLGANYICSVFQGASSSVWVNRIRPMVQAHPTFNVEAW